MKIKKALFSLAIAGVMLTGVAGTGVAHGQEFSPQVERWRPLVQAVLVNKLHQPAYWTDTVLRRLNQESSGDPNAYNGWDYNAQIGQSSTGLMQVIPSTFDTYAGPYRYRNINDPEANIYAGLNYALNTYGTLDALNQPGGY